MSSSSAWAIDAAPTWTSVASPTKGASTPVPAALVAVHSSIGGVFVRRFNHKRDGYRPPLTCRTTARGLELEREEDILRARRLGCLFVRKIAPTCNLTCFAKSGFESFQCHR